MKKVTITLLMTVLILSGCGNTSSSELTKVDLVLDFAPNTNHSGIYVADKLGYYEQAGIDLNIIQPTESTAEQLVANGTADFGISYEDSLLPAIDQGIPIKAVSAIHSHNTSGFISLAEKSIKTPKDLEGMTYCGWGSDVEDLVIKTMVESDGGDFSKVDLQPTGGDIFNSPSDECDFFWVFEGVDNIQADLAGLEYNYISQTQYGLDWYTPLIITSNDLINKNPDLVNTFIDATAKGYVYASQNPTETAQILVDENPELDIEFIKLSQEFMSKSYAVVDNKFGVFDATIYEDFAQLLIDNDIISSDFDIGSSYTNEFVN